LLDVKGPSGHFAPIHLDGSRARLLKFAARSDCGHGLPSRRRLPPWITAGANRRRVRLASSQTRARWEPLYEVTQIKGDGETHPILSATDEFADFETWDKGNLTGNAVKEPCMPRHEYARSALKEGLRIESALGANPFKFGLVGSTDAHTGLATAADDNYWGKAAHLVPSPERLTEVLGGGKAFEWTA